MYNKSVCIHTIRGVVQYTPMYINDKAELKNKIKLLLNYLMNVIAAGENDKGINVAIKKKLYIYKLRFLL